MPVTFPLRPLFDRNLTSVKNFPNGVVVFDRDGTLVEDAGQHNLKAQLKILPGIPEVLKLVSESGFGIAVASNQAGLESEKFDLQTLLDFNSSMQRVLKQQANVDIDLIVVCPHLASRNCYCRKPRIGLLTAIEESGLGKIRLFIGDSETDAGAAKDFGVDYMQFDSINLVNSIKVWAGRIALG